jgi:hypothetical protein
MATPSTGRPTARKVRAGSRWQAQKATSPIAANTACLVIIVNALPSVAYAFTLVAENTIVRPMISSRAALEISR